MGYLPIIYILVLWLTTFSCGPSEKEVKPSHHSANSISQSTMKTDTVPKIIPPPEGLAPNTIQIQGKILTISAKGDMNPPSIQIQINKILAVGSSTPVLHAKDTLMVQTSKADTLNPGEEFIGILKHRQIMTGKASPWFLVKIN